MKMAYNSKQLDSFIEKVRNEASEAAQKVLDKYHDELIKRIQNQMIEGHEIWIANGTCLIEDSKGNSIADNFSLIISDLQYNDKIKASFNPPYHFDKHKIIV